MTGHKKYIQFSGKMIDLDFSLAHSYLQHSWMDTVKNHHFIEMKYSNICSFFVVMDFFLT